jgi:hypothetical protein
MSRPQNNALHLTKREGAPASQAVVEARFAGERECCTNDEAVNERQRPRE